MLTEPVDRLAHRRHRTGKTYLSRQVVLPPLSIALNHLLLLLLVSTLVRAPERASIGPAIHLLTGDKRHTRITIVIDGRTILSGAGGSSTKRPGAYKARTIGWWSWPVPERGTTTTYLTITSFAIFDRAQTPGDSS